METTVLGLHHVTAIAGDAKRNFDFYSAVMGLRFVKKTVNFDDPHTYHFYFGNYAAEPGTILTFFPWGSAVPPGRRGTAQATETAFSVPENSLDFWMKRFDAHGIIYNKPSRKFGENYLPFIDPDGLKLELTTSARGDTRQPNETSEVSGEYAIRGFHAVTLTLTDVQATAEILTELLDYQLLERQVNRYRFLNPNVPAAAIVDLVEASGERRGHVSGGSVHHVAFRVANDEIQMALREKIAEKGLQVTEQIDRNYFHSLYFREPGGVLFEIATDNPGFTADESLDALGQSLKLPAQYERRREEIEAALVVL
ncbi:MAG: ring-cleaving dioxygenase [Cytophagaceae bacterium]|nr:ring-cleaving dioxygenase [Cytophagaceae bacterium]